MIPSELGSLQSLRLLHLSYNNFTGKIPDFIGNLSFFNALSLEGNRLEGIISPNLGNCTGLVSLDLSENNLTGPIPVELFQLSSLSIGLSHAQNNLVGTLSQEIGKLKSLTTLDLSQNDLVRAILGSIGSCTSLEYLHMNANSFHGMIPPMMGDLRGIRMLDLSSNNFTGDIPKFLEQLNLSSLNLSFNNFDGEVPMIGIFKNASVISVDGNSRLCGGLPELRLPKCDILARSKKDSRTSRVILVVIPLCSFLLLAFALSLLFYWKRRKTQTQTTEASHAQPFSRVSYGSILKATNEFSQQNLIGMGTFSAVYKGVLESLGETAAIKVLKLENQGALKLATSMFRTTIAVDVAHAIHYLHRDCEVPIIHCDIKPSNILLDNDMVAHIGDFGLAKFLRLKPHESSSIGFRGTIGYAAPEYGLGSEMTKEGDIYSFGILILEMMTGKRPTDPMFQEGLNLHSYVQMAFPDHVMEIVEPTLLSAYEEAANRNYRHRIDDANRWERWHDFIGKNWINMLQGISQRQNGNKQHCP
uniref:non-specific serine/threonine protein kinase n=1 Tax=Tanacetum cinerariifolium TaxID=118510 RepID=A0A6L2J7K3_TANCI|nr:receptor kinase-like protein Xa21 [Tanacetum cinerariifolium]